MKKFKFSLEKVLVYKEQILEREKGELAKLRAEQNSLEKAVENCNKDFSHVNNEMGEKSARGINVIQLRQFQYQLDMIRQEIDRLKKEIEKLEKEIEKQIKVVLKCSQEVAGLEKLKEKQLAEYNEAEMKANELEISEFVSGKLAREQSVDY
ncbi:MAG: flagellar export protein FliJ [Oscillospiraceae bacterium]|nr:flagellar export protein FliJ [Oscillospiraceae bacterium]